MKTYLAVTLFLTMYYVHAGVVEDARAQLALLYTKFNNNRDTYFAQAFGNENRAVEIFMSDDSQSPNNKAVLTLQLSCCLNNLGYLSAQTIHHKGPTSTRRWETWFSRPIYNNGNKIGKIE